MTHAEKFRYFRHARGLTQKQLALALGITVRSVRYIEKGEREPRIATVSKFQELMEKHMIHSQAGVFSPEWGQGGMNS